MAIGAARGEDRHDIRVSDPVAHETSLLIPLCACRGRDSSTWAGNVVPLSASIIGRHRVERHRQHGLARHPATDDARCFELGGAVGGEDGVHERLVGHV